MLVTLSKTLRKVEGQHLKLQLRRVLWPHVRNSFISLLNKPFHNKRGLKLSRGWGEAGGGPGGGGVEGEPPAGGEGWGAGGF